MTRTTATDSIYLNLVGAGVHEAYHDAAGVRIRSLECGAGPPLLLLHGTGGHAETYHRNIRALSEHFRVHAIDMIGHGYSGRPDVAYSIDDYADSLVALMDALGYDKAHISGESLGGLVGAWCAVKYPERVGRLVLNTGILVRTNEAGLAQMADLGERTRALAADLTRENIRHRMEWLVRDPSSITDELVEIRYRIYSQPGAMDATQRVMDAVQQINRGRYQGVDYYEPGVLKKINSRVLVIWTDHNPGKPLEVVLPAMADLSDGRLHVVKDAAHWPQFEQADEVNALHIDFLTGLI